jgi:hypothetical protein
MPTRSTRTQIWLKWLSVLFRRRAEQVRILVSPLLCGCTKLLISSDCFDKLRGQPEIRPAEPRHHHLTSTKTTFRVPFTFWLTNSSKPATSSWQPHKRPINYSPSGQNWTAWKGLVLPHPGLVRRLPRPFRTGGVLSQDRSRSSRSDLKQSSHETGGNVRIDS